METQIEAWDGKDGGIRLASAVEPLTATGLEDARVLAELARAVEDDLARPDLAHRRNGLMPTTGPTLRRSAVVTGSRPARRAADPRALPQIPRDEDESVAGRASRRYAGTVRLDAAAATRRDCEQTRDGKA